jgi:hypothetical protein
MLPAGQTLSQFLIENRKRGGVVCGAWCVVQRCRAQSPLVSTGAGLIVEYFTPSLKGNCKKRPQKKKNSYKKTKNKKQKNKKLKKIPIGTGTSPNCD